MSALACPHEAAPGHYVTEFIAAPLRIRAQVLAVHWVHDERAGETGYALLYRCFGDCQAMTLLADERSAEDAPIYTGDWVELRRVGERRHTILRNLTPPEQRAADATPIDWVMVWANGTCVAPAQQPRDAREQSWRQATSAQATAPDRDAELRTRHPAVAAFLDRAGKAKAGGSVLHFASGHCEAMPEGVADAPGRHDDDALPPIQPPALAGNGGW